MPAGGCLGSRGGIDVRPRACVPFDELLLGHDLEEFEDRGVPDGAPTSGAQGVVHIAHGAGPALPQNPQNRELGIGGTDHTVQNTKDFVLVNTKGFVLYGPAACSTSAH